MAALSLQEVLDLLRAHGMEPYVVREASPAGRGYSPASIIAPIEGGLYYAEGDFTERLSGISHSLILSDGSQIPDDHNTWIAVPKPQLAYYRLMTSLAPVAKAGIHATALVDADCILGTDVYIGPYCVLSGCTLQDGAQLLGNVTVNANSVIGARTIIEPYTVIGARGMVWAWDEEGRRLLPPQFGGVDVGPDCVLGTGITIVRGSTTERTRLDAGVVAAHGTKIGHGCQVGSQVHMANNVSLAGNCIVGARSFLGSGSTLSSHVEVGPGVIVGAGAVVTRTILDEYVTVAGVPARIIRRNNDEKKARGVPAPFEQRRRASEPQEEP